MSIVNVHIPDDGWFQSGCNVMPEDKQLCVVVHRYGNQTPEIYQFRKADWLYPVCDYFLDVSEKWNLDARICGEDCEPGFATMDIIKCWKPLGLPEKDNKRLLQEIEHWLEEN